MNEKRDWLLIFTFSPVQGFISASRKTRDLFASSYLLSFLTKKTLECFKNNKHVEILYPVVKDSNVEEWQLLIANFPNRFVVKIKDKSENEIKEIIHAVKSRFKHEINKITKGACEEFIGIILKIIEKEELKKDQCHKVSSLQLSDLKTIVDQLMLHIQDYFKAFAIAYPLSGNYKKDYENAERLLGAVKTFRPYKGVLDESKIPIKKNRYPDGCTTCGERLHIALDKQTQWSKIEGVSDGEAFCGICYAKRNLGKVYLYEALGIKDDQALKDAIEHFPSTHEIALAKEKHELLEKLLKEKNLAQKLDQIAGEVLKNLKEFGAKTYGINLHYAKVAEEKYPKNLWQLSAEFYSTNHIDHLLRNERKIKEDSKKRDTLLNWLKELLSLTDGLKHYLEQMNKPPYFALMFSDGDNIGRILGGDKDIVAEEFSEEFHREFSSLLSDYANKAAEEIEKPKGRPFAFARVIYAGGDDVFAFLHLSELLRVLELVNRSYKETLKELLKKPSTSAGVAIGHAKVNLRLLLQKTREAEKEAKDRWGRDAFVIKVISRSGEETSFGAKYDYGFVKPLELLKYASELYANDQISSKLSYTLREIANRYLPSGAKAQTVALILLRRELNRKVSAQEPQKEKLIRMTENFLKSQLLAHPKESLPELFKNLGALFYVARFLGGKEWSDF